MARLVFLLIALTGLASVAADMYCDGKNIEQADGRIRLARCWDAIFAEDFEGGLENWATKSYGNKLAISTSDGGQVGKCLLVTNHGADGDTAFEATSRPITVRAGTRYRFELAWRANRSLENVTGHKGSYMTQLQWLDGAGNPLDPTPFGFGKAGKQWQVTRVDGVAPEKAAGVVIRLGFDAPNLAVGESVSMDGIRLDRLVEPAAFERSGSMLSRPLRVPSDERRISWQADVPAGTSIRFQVASAPEQDGGPGEWSGPLGPDGTKEGFFNEPGPLPVAHKGRRWIRYLVTLETADSANTPALKSVTIGGVADGSWQGRDGTPPTVTDRSPTRTGDAKAPISFRLTDEIGVDTRTVRVALDDADITAKMKFADGKYTYEPPNALGPPAVETDLGRWRLMNYGRGLTIERAARRVPTAPPGVHITRETGEVDTAFSLGSRLIPVEPGAAYHLSYWSRHSMDLDGAMNSEKAYSGGVIWLAKDGAPVGPRSRIDFGKANVEWHQDTYALTAPEGAVSATVGFGFDSPNIFEGAFVDIAELTFDGPHPVREEGMNLHRITVQAADFAGNVLERDWYLLIRPPRTENIVTVRDDGMTLIGGKPFFPIGLYSVWKKPFNDNSFDKAFGDLKAAGFNLAHTYNSPRGADFAEFYAAAHRHGIRLFVASGAGANCTNVETVLWDVAQEEGQPALVAWYLADDTASHVGYSELRTVSDAIHDIDPAHITVQADGVGAPPISRYTNYVNSTDGFLPELYPIRDDSDKGVPKIIADMKTIQSDLAQAGTRRRTIWAIVQYFQGWGWPRYPTRQELWAMTYLSIIHGANGMTWYTYGGHGDNHGVTDNPEVWKNICDLGGELSKLQDVLVERTGPQPPAPEILSGPAKDALGYPSISILLKEHGGKRWLLAANSANAEASARFLINGATTIALPFEGRQLTPGDGGFTDAFGPYAVHVYLLSPK